jgi:hypothetical protein
MANEIEEWLRTLGFESIEAGVIETTAVTKARIA